jgi:hypothetical protein
METLEEVSNFDQDIKFITGFAGSGKSTKLSSLATEQTLVLTPTHKAAEVLMAKGVKNVYTIHSTLKLVPTLNENFRKGQKMQRLNQIGKTDLSKIKDVFIDEFSMINQGILDKLLEVLPVTAKVTIFGDPFQLPPVDGEAIDPLIYTDNIEELTTQHRADNPHIVETFMRFMQYIKTGDNSISLVLNPSIKKGSLKNFNPDTDRALAFTNKKVLSINNEIAGILGKTEEFMPGDECALNGIPANFVSDTDEGLTIFPTCISKGKLMDRDKLALAAQKTKNDMDKYGTEYLIDEYPICTVNIDGDNYSMRYDPDHYHTSKRLKEKVTSAQFNVINSHNLDKDVDLKVWCRENRGAKGVKERGIAWQEFIAHSNLVFSLQRPYATTVHKSQGSEFSTVYLAQADIKQSIKRGYYEQYARLMYVALSRAIDNIIIID